MAHAGHYRRDTYCPVEVEIRHGYRTAYSNFVDDMSWRSVFGTQKYITVAVETGAITADACWVWIRRRGNPSDLTLELCSDSTGDPGTVLKTATVSTSTITDVVSVLHKFDWTGTEALSGSTTYHIKIYGGSVSNEANHWDIGVDVGTSLSKISAAGSSWTVCGFRHRYALWMLTLPPLVLLRDTSNFMRCQNGTAGTATTTPSTVLR